MTWNACGVGPAKLDHLLRLLNHRDYDIIFIQEFEWPSDNEISLDDGELLVGGHLLLLGRTDGRKTTAIILHHKWKRYIAGRCIAPYSQGLLLHVGVDQIGFVCSHLPFAPDEDMFAFAID